MSLPAEPPMPPGSEPETAESLAEPAGLPPPPPFPPWGIAGGLAPLAAFALTQLGAVLGVAFLIKNAPADWWAGEPRVYPAVRIGIPASILISHAIGWLAIALLLGRRHGLPLLEGLRMAQSPGRRAIVLAVLGGIGVQVAGGVLVQFFPPPPDFVFPLEQFLLLGRWALPLLFLFAVVMAPLLEEALFRGLLLPALRKIWGFPASALLVTGLFTALHASQTGTYWPPLVAIFACGWFMARWRERSGSLWPSIAFHVGFNLTALAPLIVLELLGFPIAEHLRAR